MLANVYVHFAVDLWCEQVVKQHSEGEAMLCRYADDWVCAFRYKRDAERCYRVLPTRLDKFGLKVEPSKTQIRRFSRFHPGMERCFSFLGCEFYWFPGRKGTPRIMRRTARKKLQSVLKRIKEWIRLNRHEKKHWFFGKLNTTLQGHYQYYGVRGNSQSLWRFYEAAIEACFKWLHRRSQRRRYPWQAFNRLLSYIPLAKPRITELKRLHQATC